MPNNFNCCSNYFRVTCCPKPVKCRSRSPVCCRRCEPIVPICCRRCDPIPDCSPVYPPICPPSITIRLDNQNLVSNQLGVAPNIDPNLINSWGVLVDANRLVVANNGTGLISYYTLEGGVLTNITVPSTLLGGTGNPTGIVKNNTLNFPIAPSFPAVYLVATEDGTVAGFNSNYNSATAITLVNRSSSGAIYKGLAITPNYLYVADFHNNRIDTFNSGFVLQSSVNFPFNDPNIPPGFAPFNIVFLNGRLYVTYARQDVSARDDVPGVGNGFINVFDTNGQFIRRFASRGCLNSPWAIVAIPRSCHTSLELILVGNSGDGTISIYNLNGSYLGKVRNFNDTDLIIDGLWGIAQLPVTNNITLYTASGPNFETNGLITRLTS
ncbi:TIGR03118 family protein [Cotonvirus japonicus]|uniref:TIGR03118 family protein n=1 Tax=Cotonvirus japonicus TaxID=2811091 RepID=A0ABM7NTZ9_9VIRU|nr:TIGR03118 family protein [Cotonvirus japonicus]BCS83653.1 TIGR03118 family protein [Cotonvirus japonicus]